MAFGQYSHPGSTSEARRDSSKFTRGDAKEELQAMTTTTATTTTTTTKRQKQVFDTDEIPHLWAHKTQESARNKQRNLYFIGDTIYSYGDHFPIARHVEGKGGKKAILFTSRSYSNTTSGHISQVRRAIPGGIEVFETSDPTRTPARVLEEMLIEIRQIKKDVLNVAGTTPAPFQVKLKRGKLITKGLADVEVDALLGKRLATDAGRVTLIENGLSVAKGLSVSEARYFIDQLDKHKDWTPTPALLAKILKARLKAEEMGKVRDLKPGAVARSLARFRELQSVATSLAAFIGRKPPKRELEVKNLEALEAIEVNYQEQAAARSLAAQQAYNTRHAEERLKRIEVYEQQAKQYRATYEERSEKFRAGRAGEHVYFHPGEQVLLRVSGDKSQVETSLGAKVPLEHVRKALPLVLKLIAEGRTYQRNGHEIRLGHYTVDQITSDGTVIAGCHKIGRDEVRRIAELIAGIATVAAPAPAPALTKNPD